MKTTSLSAWKRTPGFTILELLAVMAIMGILLAVTVPSISGMMQSNNISSAGQTVSDQVNLARQTASAQNITVDVICMQLPGSHFPQTGGFNAIQLWAPSRGPISTTTGLPTGQAVGRIINLPDGVVISQDTTKFSTLFATYPRPTQATQPPALLPNGVSPATSGTIPTPAAATPLYVYFSINPNGLVGPLYTATGTDGIASSETTAPNMPTMAIAVVPAHSATATTLTAVPNYIIIQVNPITAATLIYRP
jgi:uncharacterized protein (TIGR02596 family)